MKLAEFVQKHNGQHVNFDNVHGAQCMDLYRQYVGEVLGLPQSPLVAGAADVWRRYQKAHYERIRNGLDNYPAPGDIVIWSRSYGPAGHIAIAVEADRNSLTCFSQNDPGGTRAGLKLYNYRGVLGWLHPKEDA